ncbi:hypothetical protein N7510_002766 [Penicillium lagena]|uniref:uncharacterized protein n=1 Tax=Penicillium lagena TaxID=94218 RepID=UPI00253F73AA|nr:uncharacterized protein N7510_002766 [Penicillium lagena]KAJ5618782.1 hypothetical protein N7510_002766 [Penicillium lagena]
MAGGSKKPVNIFRLKDLGEPQEVFNWRLWFAVLSFGLMGAARGVDEGLISGAFDSVDFQRYINYESYSKVEQTNIKGNVSAMVQIGSVGVCDRIGRIWATRQLCLLWILGIAIFMGNDGSLGAVYAGRFVAGLGVGQTVVVAPVYLAEIEVPTSLHIIFAGLVFLLSFFQEESPRYLVKKGKLEKAIANLAKVRNLPPDHEYIVREITAIQTSHQMEMEATMGSGPWGVVKEMFLVPSNFYRIYLASMTQILSQWSGAGSITIYATDLFKLLGITGSNENLLVTAIFGIIKLLAAVACALFLVDVIGRKRALLLGIALQAISMIYVASFLSAVPEIGVVKDFKVPDSQKGASKGAIAMIYISGFGWALGWNSMQYLLTAELFPLRIRALATSLAMTLHFANQYGNSRAVPNMLLPIASGGITPKGTFWLFAVVTVLGGLWVWFSVPETAGRSLESMDRLFALPWYQIGRHGNRDAEARDQAINEKTDMIAESRGTTRHVETQGATVEV